MEFNFTSESTKKVRLKKQYSQLKNEQQHSILIMSMQAFWFIGRSERI